MFFFIQPIIQAEQIQEMKNLCLHYNMDTCVVSYTNEIDQQEFLNLCKKKFQFYFYLKDFDLKYTNKDEYLRALENIVPFFFFHNYSKTFRHNPFLLISLQADNESIKKVISEVADRLLKEHGFNRTEIIYITQSSHNNFQKQDSTAFYNFKSLTEDVEGHRDFTACLKSGVLIAKRYLLPFIHDDQFKMEIEKIHETIDNTLNKEIIKIFQTNHNLILENELLLQQNSRHKEQITNYENFLELTKDSYQYDLQWYINEIEKIKQWYHKEYEVLPKWYKRVGHILKAFKKKK